MAHSPVEAERETPAADAAPLVGLWSYIRNARFAAILTAPLIYGCLIPFVLLDLALSLYQTVCFPVYRIPRVPRSDYFQYDRARLRYLNLLERLNCFYCSYANGLVAYASEIAARTEQHWCPIRHASHPLAPHSRYGRFVPYRDAAAYRQHGPRIRQDFSDLS